MINGGGGNDTLTGGDGADLINGGGGNDVIKGARGNDVDLLGGGGETALWDPGDGSDTVEGQGGNDALNFNGANVSEHIDVSANGSRVRLSRDVGAITMDLNEVEAIHVNTLGGANVVGVGDLAGTTARSVGVDLTSFGAGDGQADRVVVDGTAAADQIEVSGAGPAATVNGLAVTTSVVGAEPTLDTMAVDGQGGNDTIDVTPGDAALSVVADGGADTDTVVTNGTIGDDLFQVTPGVEGAPVSDGLSQFFEATAPETLQVNGGAGNDTILGGNGVATLAPIRHRRRQRRRHPHRHRR